MLWLLFLGMSPLFPGWGSGSINAEGLGRVLTKKEACFGGLNPKHEPFLAFASSMGTLAEHLVPL